MHFLFYFLLSIVCYSKGWGLEYNLVKGLPNIYLTPSSEKIGVTWANGNVWDKPLIQKFHSILAKHEGFFVVLDLGAQTGSFSLLAKYFPNSQWHAFEPIQEAADTLQTNLFLNDIHNVSIYPVAVADFTGRATLKMPNMDDWGLATLGSNVLRFKPVGEREVECIDLDSFVAAKQIDKVHFMKLDTEGWEFYALKGAERLIRRDHPVILMEYNEINMKQCNVTKEQLDLFLREMGYVCELVSSEDVLCMPMDKK